MSRAVVLLAVPDLFFATRIETTAKALGVTVESVAIDAVVERCRLDPPALVVLDLHAPGDPLAVARALKSDARTRAIPLVGFHSHVDRDLGTAAAQAGIDRVMPRSAFTVKLAEILGTARPDPPA